MAARRLGCKSISRELTAEPHLLSKEGDDVCACSVLSNCTDLIWWEASSSSPVVHPDSTCRGIRIKWIHLCRLAILCLKKKRLSARLQKASIISIVFFSVIQQVHSSFPVLPSFERPQSSQTFHLLVGGMAQHLGKHTVFAEDQSSLPSSLSHIQNHL